MTAMKWVAAAALGAVAIVGPASAQGQDQQQTSQSSMSHRALTPSDLKWGPAPPGLPSGAQAAVLSGDPTGPGPFVVRLRATQDNWMVRPHSHSTPEKLTILQGTFHTGKGTTFDRSAAKDYPAGSFLSLPPDTYHYAWADQGTIVQIDGQGPFDIKYANPSDDPRNQGVGGAGQQTQTPETVPPSK